MKNNLNVLRRHFMSMAWCNTAVSPLLTHCSLALSYRYDHRQIPSWRFSFITICQLLIHVLRSGTLVARIAHWCVTESPSKPPDGIINFYCIVTSVWMIEWRNYIFSISTVPNINPSDWLQIILIKVYFAMRTRDRVIKWTQSTAPKNTQNELHCYYVYWKSVNASHGFQTMTSQWWQSLISRDVKRTN